MDTHTSKALRCRKAAEGNSLCVGRSGFRAPAQPVENSPRHYQKTALFDRKGVSEYNQADVWFLEQSVAVNDRR